MAESSFKVVRDRIPEIIGLSGSGCAVNKLSDLSFLPELENKLKEEIEEYLDSREPEELADLLEIIFRIAELRGSSKDELEGLRLRKREEKGGFEKNLILLNLFEEKGSFPELRSTDPAGKRFWFKGNLKQVCVTAPAWEEQYEHHIKDIEL